MTKDVFQGAELCSAISASIIEERMQLAQLMKLPPDAANEKKIETLSKKIYRGLNYI